MLEKRLGNYSFWLAEDVRKTCNDGWHFPPKYPKLDQQVMEWFSQQREQGWYLLCLSERVRVFVELNDIVFQCVGNRDFDWPEMCCCHDNFITCHEKSAAVTNLRLSRSKIRLLFYFS